MPQWTEDCITSIVNDPYFKPNDSSQDRQDAACTICTVRLNSVKKITTLMNEVAKILQNFNGFSKAGDDIVAWVTVNGAHIPIREGDNKGPQGNGVRTESTKKINGIDSKTIHAEILAEAKDNPDVKNPEQLANNLTKEYEMAQGTKGEIDDIADKVAGRIDGAKVAETSLKGFNSDGTRDFGRAVEKYNSENQIRDLARNTIVVGSVDQAMDARDMLLKEGVVVSDSKDNFTNPTLMGYRGIGGNYTGPNGSIGEVQVNVPEVLVYKDDGSVKSIVGASTYNSIETKFNEAELTPGEGHALYNEYRGFESKAASSGRTVESAGRTDYVFTEKEQIAISDLVDKSANGYETALSLASSRNNP